MAPPGNGNLDGTLSPLVFAPGGYKPNPSGVLINAADPGLYPVSYDIASRGSASGALAAMLFWKAGVNDFEELLNSHLLYVPGQEPLPFVGKDVSYFLENDNSFNIGDLRNNGGHAAPLRARWFSGGTLDIGAYQH
jgi:hypothetical protein